MTVVCITGMHRSGTSMIARLLNLSGLYLGPESDISRAADDNPEGFWENIHFLRLDDEILSELGGAWDKVPDLSPGWQDRPALLWCRTRAAALIQEFSPRPFWGWKDPRASLTVDLWQSLQPDLKVVVCVRNPLDVVNSLGRRGYSSGAFGFELWQAYNHHLLAAVPASNRIITHYDAYFDNPAAELERVLAFLGMSPSPEQVAQALAFIKLPLRHQRTTFQQLLDQKPPLELLKLYRDMCLQAGPLAAASIGPEHAAFDLNSEDYDRYLDRREKQRLSEEREDLLTRLNEQRETMLARLNEQRATMLARLNEEREGLLARLGEQQRAAAALQERVAALSGEVAQYQIFAQTDAWKLARSLDRLRQKLAPPGSRRDRLLQALARWTVVPLQTARQRARIKPYLALLRGSELFDPDWYLANNPDVAASGQDPALHYLQVGGYAGRDPGPHFSSSWYLQQYADVRLAGLNPLVHYLAGGQAHGRLPYPPIPSPVAAPSPQAQPAAAPSAGGLTVFTICSRNFTAHARTLFDSVRQFHPGAELFLFLCDDTDPTYEAEQFPFRVVHLAQLGIPGLEEMSQRYNITEFNTAIKPYAFAYLFKQLGKGNVLYLDPDILLVSPLQEVVEAFERGSECVLTPHILEPAENAELSDVKMLQFGIYNLGFVGFRNTPRTLQIVDWWARQLVEGCVINLAEGLFVDQKWADLFPAFINSVYVLHHPGYNVAYWNLPQRTITYTDGTWLSNGQPLRFVHFSGHKLDNPYFLSSHSGTVTRDTIGDLKYLVDRYHELLYANGQEAYSRIPYAFSWNGASGINLHTPKPPDIPDATDAASAGPTAGAGQPGIGRDPLRKLLGAVSLAPAAARRSGGWMPLLTKSVGTLRHGGLAALRGRVQHVSYQVQVERSVAEAVPAMPVQANTEPAWVPHVLVIDSSTPKPDRDAGGLSTFNLCKIYIDLGYAVSFIPSDLAFAGAYTEALSALGVRCLHAAEIGSVHDHLRREGRDYAFVVLCRAPIAAHYMDDVRRYAPQAKILFDTIDLHHLRDQRQAELDGSPEKLKAAARSKDLELDIIHKSDVTIVLSSAEKELLRRETPDATVRLIPLIFAESPGECPPFEARRDFLFVGGFPHTPNIDAVLYFAEEIFPRIRQALPDVKFHVVGNAPPPQVLALAHRDGIIVHGYVKDIAPLFNACRLSVVPLRYGAGIKGKIATSLAYGVPVVATGLAVEGMQLTPGEHILVEDDPAAFAATFVEAYRSPELWGRLSEAGRRQALREYSPLAGHRRIAALMRELDPEHRDLDLHALRSFQEYDGLRQALAEDIAGRTQLELELVRFDQPSFSVPGFCAVCGQKSSFVTSFMYSVEKTPDGRPIPNWREHLVCPRCGFVNRLRAAMHFFYHWVRPSDSAAIYITEQTTPLYSWLRAHHPNLVGSEYFGSAVPFGTQKDGLRNEDLTALTFAADSFDYVLSFDVMEHVPDDMAALREVYRCLKPGGVFLFAAPFSRDRTEKVVRARLCPDGTIEHLLPPEYRGNPVDMEHGSLCYRYFAWDLLDDLRSAGFVDPQIITYWSRDYAYLGVEQFIFMATKPA